MKALLLTALSTFEFTDVPNPLAGRCEVRIDVQACGICGSDIHGMDGRSGFWVVSRLSGMTDEETLKSWSVMLTVVSLAGLVVTWLGSLLIPLV